MGEDKQIFDGGSVNVNLPENAIELQKMLIHPESEWGDMNMDLVVSNLAQFELFLVREHLELAGQLALLGLEKASNFFVRNAMIIVNTARSKEGFERRMLATQIVQQSKEVGQKEKKKRSW